jgi:hypothetical protein
MKNNFIKYYKVSAYLEPPTFMIDFSKGFTEEKQISVPIKDAVKPVNVLEHSITLGNSIIPLDFSK